MESGSILDEMEIQEIISMLTPNEVRDAQEKLKTFLKEYSVIGLERTVVLAYLIGEKSGLYTNTDVSAANFAERLRQIYRMGKKHGFTEATMLFNGQKKKSKNESNL